MSRHRLDLMVARRHHEGLGRGAWGLDSARIRMLDAGSAHPPHINFEFSILNFEFPPALPMLGCCWGSGGGRVRVRVRVRARTKAPDRSRTRRAGYWSYPGFVDRLTLSLGEL
jgi:hypothetical protein